MARWACDKLRVGSCHGRTVAGWGYLGHPILRRRMIEDGDMDLVKDLLSQFYCVADPLELQLVMLS